MPADPPGRSILVVDDAPENLRLLGAVLRRGGFRPRPVTSGAQALEAAALDPPALVLMDLDMPGMSGLEACRRLKRDERLRNIPVIFISGHLGTDDKVEALRAGGVDYVTKPFQEEEVLARVEVHLRLEDLQAALRGQAQALERQVAEQVQATSASRLATIYSLAKLVEARDGDTGRHIERVQALSRALAVRIQTQERPPAQATRDFATDLEQAAALHDIGKVSTPDAVLLKRGALDPEERAEMRRHCVLGAQTLAAVLERHPDNQFLRMGVEVARSHHERWDGAGYPDGLAGEAIPLVARIVALADFYDAMVSDRVYRPALDHAATRAMIEAGSGSHFDPAVVAAFCEVAGEFQRIEADLQG